MVIILNLEGKCLKTDCCISYATGVYCRELQESEANCRNSYNCRETGILDYCSWYHSIINKTMFNLYYVNINLHSAVLKYCPLCYPVVAAMFGFLKTWLCMFCCYIRGSGIASPLYQEGQSESIFPIFAFSSWLFPSFPKTFFFPIFGTFFTVGGTLAPLLPPPPPTGYVTEFRGGYSWAFLTLQHSALYQSSFFLSCTSLLSQDFDVYVLVYNWTWSMMISTIFWHICRQTILLKNKNTSKTIDTAQPMKGA